MHSNSSLLRRARIAGSACALALGLASCGGGHDAAITDPNAIIVEMPGTAFSPFNTIVKVNGTVSFDFPGNEHDVTFTAKAGAPANIPVTRNQVVTRTFTTVGVFPYDCKVHPGMSGQITVTE